MTKTELNKLSKQIVKEHGQPQWDMNQPVNESAKLLLELRNRYRDSQKELIKTRELVKRIDEIPEQVQLPLLPLPEELIKDSWLTPFNAEQKIVITEWITDITAKPKTLADKTGQDIKLVRNTLNSEAFKLLRANLSLAHKNLLPIEASLKLRSLLHSKNEKIAFAAAQLVLEDAHLYKTQATEVNVHKATDVVLDKKTEDRLKQLGDALLADENEDVDPTR